MPALTFTRKADAAAVLGPIFAFAHELWHYFDADVNAQTSTVLATIDDGKIRPGTEPAKDGPQISQHQRLKIETALAKGHSEVLAPLSDLLSHVPPLAPSSCSLQLVVSHGPGFGLQLYRDNVKIYDGHELKTFVQRIYVFLRTHENLDMTPRLRPYGISRSYGRCPMQETVLFADCAENALMRFAACSAEVQSLIRQRVNLQCSEIDQKDYDARIKMIDGRTREAPAEPKSWILA